MENRSIATGLIVSLSVCVASAVVESEALTSLGGLALLVFSIIAAVRLYK